MCRTRCHWWGKVAQKCGRERWYGWPRCQVMLVRDALLPSLPHSTLVMCAEHSKVRGSITKPSYDSVNAWSKRRSSASPAPPSPLMEKFHSFLFQMFICLVVPSFFRGDLNLFSNVKDLIQNFYFLFHYIFRRNIWMLLNLHVENFYPRTMDDVVNPNI